MMSFSKWLDESQYDEVRGDVVIETVMVLGVDSADKYKYNANVTTRLPP